jgi:hypothetical protein
MRFNITLELVIYQSSSCLRVLDDLAWIREMGRPDQRQIQYLKSEGNQTRSGHAYNLSVINIYFQYLNLARMSASFLHENSYVWQRRYPSKSKQDMGPWRFPIGPGRPSKAENIVITTSYLEGPKE